MADPPDPAAFFRQMLGQWEAMTNSVGGEAMKSENFARMLHGATAAATNAQGATQQFMEKALAAANVPTRTDFEDLSARLGRVEAALFRIESLLGESRGAADDRPRPTRNRQPPGADA